MLSLRRVHRQICGLKLYSKSALINTGLNRSIFSSRQLTIDDYVAKREIFLSINSPKALVTNRNALHRRLNTKIVKPSVFSTEFPQFLYCIEDTAQDSELLVLGLKKLIQNKGSEVHLPSLGLIVMRALYYIQNDKIAQQIFNRLATTEFFKRTKSNLIYFDLLYKKEKYSQIIDDARVHIELMHNDKQWKLSRAISLVIYAACYKQNTNQSFEYAKCLHDEQQKCFASREYLIYLGAMALEQNSPHMAEQYLIEAWPVQHSALSNLRLKAALQRGHASDAINVMFSVLSTYSDSYDKICFSKALIDHAKSTFPRCSGEQLQLEFESVLSRLQANGHIVDKSLDELLLELTQSNTSHERSMKHNERRYRRGSSTNSNYQIQK